MAQRPWGAILPPPALLCVKGVVAMGFVMDVMLWGIVPAPAALAEFAELAVAKVFL